MTPEDRLMKVTIIIGIALIVLTALAIYLIYGAYLFKEEWPWMRFSIIMAVLTCLWSYAFWFDRTTMDKDISDRLWYVVVFVPFDVLLMYPGHKALGLYVDHHFEIFIIIIMIIHGFGFYFIQKEIQKYLKQKYLNNRSNNYET
ncbi:MAG TPA: hypothetical protein PK016_01660 [Candidatus Atribacteria bacterium]|nr:hypothetical protein [Candidatus Atribacteria bacterium]